jgi:hypothetical protein
VLGVDARMWIDLEGVVVVGRVFEQAVEGIEHFVREEEEEFSVTIVSVVASMLPIMLGHTLRDHHSPNHLHRQT